MMATGSLGPLYTDRRAGEGNLPRLMPCLQVSHAAHNAVAELANCFPVPRSDSAVSAVFPARASHEHLPSLRTCRRSKLVNRSSGFPICHAVYPRSPSSLFVTESEVATERFSEQRKSFRDSENLSGSQKADVNG